MSLQPSAPLQELECRGLLSPSLTYEDPWLQLNGRQAVQRLMHQVCCWIGRERKGTPLGGMPPGGVECHSRVQ